MTAFQPSYPLNQCVLYSQEDQCLEQDNLMSHRLVRYNSSENRRGKPFLEIDQKHMRNQQTLEKMRKIKQLRKQRQQLQYSLQILKTSAIMVLAQKQDEIQRLKKLNSLQSHEKLQYIQSQLLNSSKIQGQLKQRQQQIHHQIHNSRSKYICQLQQRQQLIDNLNDEILQLQQQIQNLLTIDQVKEEKIKLLKEDNNKLFFQLQFSTLNISLKEHRENNRQLGFKLNSEESVVSSIHNKSSVSLHELESNQHQRTYLSCKLQEILRNNKDEVQDLKHFYEKRIVDLKQIYQKQLLEPNEYQQHNNQQSVNSNHHRNSLSSQNNRDNRDYRDNRDNRDNKIDNRIYNGYMLNLDNMYPIEENAQELLQTSRDNRNNLKYEIKLQDYHQNFAPLRQINITNQDTQSQFTTKYFQNPFRFMKKNKSVQSLSVYNQNDEQKTLIKQYKQLAVNKQQNQGNNKQMNFWNKACIFGIGLISGIAVTALIYSVIKIDEK